LQAAGWTVVRVWEHDRAEVGAQRVRQALVRTGESLADRSPL
jgi:hypothetical protein